MLGAIAAILEAAEVIALSSGVLRRAGKIQVDFDPAFQHAIVMASVVSHLEHTRAPESCFLNRNTKDCDDPNLREILDGLGCKFFGRFDNALDYIEARVRNRSTTS